MVSESMGSKHAKQTMRTSLWKPMETARRTQFSETSLPVPVTFACQAFGPKSVLKLGYNLFQESTKLLVPAGISGSFPRWGGTPIQYNPDDRDPPKRCPS